MEAKIVGSELMVHVEKAIYSEDVIHKCFYWYGGTFEVDVSTHDENLFLIRLKPKNGLVDLQAVIEKIRRDLIDFKLRDIVTKETKTIRELIVAKAFAYYEPHLDDPT